MTATVSYKGSTLTTVDNTTRTLGTSGKYMEDDITIVDVSGGGGGGVEPKQINFIDYDGTILHAYTKEEINAMTSQSDLPANPTHTGLTSQGWNWTLAQIKTQLTAMPDDDVTVGQMYTTSSGSTEINVEFVDSARLSPTLTITVNGTITVDWGDGTTADTVTGTSLTSRKAVPHTYASAGNYTISIKVISGSFSFYGSSTYTILRKNTTVNENKVYANCIKNIRLGTGITSIKDNAFNSCCSLSSITIPSGVTSIADNAFYDCYSLSSITIPSDVTSIAGNAFCNCYSLSSITIPSGVTSIGTRAFDSCYSLSSITIPSGVTSIGVNAFNVCLSLSSITIPSGVTSIGNNAFNACRSLSSITILSDVTSIGDNAFNACRSLSSITIPSSVTSIGNGAFESCYGVKEYHIKPTIMPTAGTKIFNNIVSDCIIYVPSAKLNDYKTASNWSTYASYMQGE